MISNFNQLEVTMKTYNITRVILVDIVRLTVVSLIYFLLKILRLNSMIIHIH